MAHRCRPPEVIPPGWGWTCLRCGRRIEPALPPGQNPWASGWPPEVSGLLQSPAPGLVPARPVRRGRARWLRRARVMALLRWVSR
jgi:hypothetical protein